MPATTATDTVLAILEQRPDATTAEVAAAAGLGRSTVGKALAALERDGRVSRTPGGHDGGRRRPDRWTMQPSPTNGDAQPGTPRLHKGELRALVLEHLQQHPDVEHSPTAVAKTLGRSAGVVSTPWTASPPTAPPSRPTQSRAGSPPHPHDQRPSTARSGYTGS